MARKSNLSASASSSAMEKYLKEIYALLNMGCNKKALQEVDKLPKKFRELPVFKALKSLALIRMYKRRQAFDILNEINPDDDLDEVTLQTMTSCYKESVDVGRIVDLYEAASKRKPNDPEIMIHLFMAHVRVFNFKRQKEISMQMYRNFPKKKRLYSFWTIMSLVMQSQETSKSCNQGESAPDKKVCLGLAEKMCEKMIDEERNHEEIELYLMILRKQNKHEEEYRFLTGPICLRITDHLSWFNRRRAYLCLDLKMYSRAFKHYFPNLIEEYPDQIEYYQGLFKSAFLLDTEAPSQQQPVAITDQQQSVQNSPQQQTGTPVKSTSALAECFDIVERQCSSTLETNGDKEQQKTKSQPTSKNLSRTSSLNPNRRRLLRGPFMARIELFHTILSNESVLPQNVYNLCKSQFENKYSNLNFLLLDYFQSFSRKVICFYDLTYMIKQFKLTDEDKVSLVQSIESWVNDLKKINPEISDYDVFHITLNYHMLKHSLHKYSTSDKQNDRLNLAKFYIEQYDNNRGLVKSSSPTEFQPVDNYCLLAVNSIMTNAVDLDNLASQQILSDSVLLSLIVLVEQASANSPSNHQLKLTLLKLYSFIGASKQCSAVLLTLDIKHFQIDTLGHLLNPVLYNTGNYSLSRESLETCLEFYAHGVRECFEGLTTSYRDGKYSKIEEISSVLKRLCDSLNATQCVLLKGIVSNMSATNPDELLNASLSFDPFKGLHRMFRCPDCKDTIKDSRDLKILKSLHAEVDELVQKRREETLQDEQLWLKLRYYLVRSAYLQLGLVRGQCNSKEEREENLAELAIGKEVVQELKPMLEKTAATNPTDDKRYSYFEPESSPFRWKHVKFQVLIALVEPLLFLSSGLELDTQFKDDYSKNLDTLIANLEAQLASIRSLVDMKQALLSLTISIEFISLATTSLVSLSLTSKQSTENNKQSSSQPQKTLSSSNKQKSVPHQMLNKTEAQLTRLCNLIKNIDLKSLPLDKLEEKLVSNLSREQQTSSATLSKVKDKLIDSYSESLKEIEMICKGKVELCRLKNC